MTDKDFMLIALEQAALSAAETEVPVGAVITRNGEVVSTGRNRRETGKNALAHAEIEAIDKACKALRGWRLWECEMYVTLEPYVHRGNYQLPHKAPCLRGGRPEIRLLRLGDKPF